VTHLGGGVHPVGRPSSVESTTTSLTLRQPFTTTSSTKPTPTFQQATVTPAFALPGIGRGAASTKPPST